MKIGFSTLGCPEWSWREILAVAKDLGYDGIELRGVGDEMYMPRAHPFIDENIQDTKRSLEDLQLEIPCITSACYLYGEDSDRYIQEGKDYIDIAQKLGSSFVRVLGDRDPHPSGIIDHERVSAGLNELGEYGRDKGVEVLIESNGVYADSKVLSKLMENLDSDNVGVLWDIHHPYRFMEEDVENTYRRLSPFIRYVHVKDSTHVDGRLKYSLLGEGDVPLKEAFTLLRDGGYDGYLTLEWVRRWAYDLEEPGIVFPHFIYTMRQILSEA